MREDCFDAQAAIWLSLGRLWKYFTTSNAESFSAFPKKQTCRSKGYQGKSKLTLWLCSK